MADPASHADRSAGEKKFIEQMTRKLLVEWCDEVINAAPIKGGLIRLNSENPYVQYAATRKSPFISNKKQEPGVYKILAGGWNTAAAFLKR